MQHILQDIEVDLQSPRKLYGRRRLNKARDWIRATKEGSMILVTGFGELLYEGSVVIACISELPFL